MNSVILLILSILTLLLLAVRDFVTVAVDILADVDIRAPGVGTARY